MTRTAPSPDRSVPAHQPRRGTARLLGAAALLAVAVTGLGAGLDAGHADGRHAPGPGQQDRAERWTPHRTVPDRAPAKEEVDPRTIVEVGGSAADGFRIHRYDGTSEYPPTDSEARAECNEHDARVDRVRCRAQVARWYRDLAEMQRSLDYAYRH